MSTDYRTSRRVAYEREDRGVEQRQLFAIFFAAVVVAMVVFLLGVLAGKGRGPAAAAGAPGEAGVETAAAAEPNDAPRAEPASEPPSDTGTEEVAVAGTVASEAISEPTPEPEAAPAKQAALPAATPAPVPALLKPKLTSPAPGPAQAKAAAKPGAGGFAVQVLASSDPAKAKALGQKLKSKGYAAYVVNEGGDKLYRVRVGHYSGRDGAEALKARLVKGEGLRSAWIVVLPEPTEASPVPWYCRASTQFNAPSSTKERPCARKHSRPTRTSSSASEIFEVFFELDAKREELKKLEEKLSHPDLWARPEGAQRDLRRQRELQAALDLAASLEREVGDLDTLVELDAEGEEVSDELVKTVAALEAKVRASELAMLLGAADDKRNAVVAIHAGAGGTEAQDWVEMLARQYTRYAEAKGFKVSVVDSLEGEEAGLKSITFEVEGDYAYGIFSAERGVHRLVRISPFDAAKRRHTSFASLDVFPEVDEEVEIELRDEDIRIDTYRSSGHGGQHINVTDSAVRITHLPTGLVAQCQNERSQHRNKDKAMAVLKARLYQLRLDEEKKRVDAENANRGEISFGNQIRSYVLAPYRLVKDHRSGYEVTDPDCVLNGDLDGFVKAWLLVKKRGTLPPRGAAKLDDEV